MKALHISIVLFIFGGMSLAILYGCFPIFTPHTGLPGLPTAFDWTRLYFLIALTTSFFVPAIVLLIISHNRTDH